jgi:hypothetical protein
MEASRAALLAWLMLDAAFSAAAAMSEVEIKDPQLRSLTGR